MDTVSTDAVERRAPEQSFETARPLPPIRRPKLAWHNFAAMGRFLWMRARYRQVKGGLFYRGKGCWFEFGPDAEFEVGAHTRFLGRFTCSVTGRVKIGPGCHFSRDTQLSCMDSITIGRNSGFAEGVAIHDMTHCFGPEWAHDSFWDKPFWTAPISIGDNVWVGCKATIIAGVTIGDDVVIAANSVVNKDIPSHCVVAGVPARVIRSWADEAEATAPGRQRVPTGDRA